MNMIACFPSAMKTWRNFQIELRWIHCIFFIYINRMVKGRKDIQSNCFYFTTSVHAHDFAHTRRNIRIHTYSG